MNLKSHVTIFDTFSTSVTGPTDRREQGEIKVDYIQYLSCFQTQKYINPLVIDVLYHTFRTQLTSHD